MNIFTIRTLYSKIYLQIVKYDIMTKKKFTVALAIIAKNEYASSRVIFPKIPKNSIDRIFVIDGNSTDGTLAFYKKNNISVFQQKVMGLGAASQEARKHCHEDGIIFFHPDGNENPKDIAKIAEALRNGHKFVIPSRMMKGGFNEEDDKLLKPRKWFNVCFAFVVNLLFNRTNHYVTELVQGFRGIETKTFDIMNANTTDRTVDCQQVIKAMKHKVRIYEFPTKEGKRIAGETNFKSFSTGYLNAKTAFLELLSSD